MREVLTKICPKCGIEFKTVRGHQRFCSKSCSNRGRRKETDDYDHSLEWKQSEEYGTWECPYQVNVGCLVRECSKCGWNPKVAQARLDAYNKRYNNER